MSNNRDKRGTRTTLIGVLMLLSTALIVLVSVGVVQIGYTSQRQHTVPTPTSSASADRRATPPRRPVTKP